MTSTVRWCAGTINGANAIEPEVDGVLLSELVARFERSRGFDPAAGYAGLVPGYYNFGEFREYLSGTQKPWPGERVPLLGCDCGEWGCWPLTARVVVDERLAVWDRFVQPYREARNYTGFGPFLFDGPEYRRAVAAAALLAASDDG